MVIVAQLQPSIPNRKAWFRGRAIKEADICTSIVSRGMFPPSIAARWWQKGEGDSDQGQEQQTELMDEQGTRQKGEK